MQVLYERCAAVDVGKDVIAVANRQPGDGPAGRVTHKRTFKTFYGALREAARWLESLGVTHVAMEATGIYSMPVYHALIEHGNFVQVLVCNAAHVKNVPGRKTDLLTELPGRLGEVGGRRRSGWLRSLAVINDGDAPRGVSRLVVPQSGSLEATGDLFEPYRLVDGDGVVAAWRRRSSPSWPRAGGRRRRSGRTGWTCCAGSGSCGRSGSAGIRRPGSRRGTFCRWVQVADKPSGRTGGIPAAGRPGRRWRWRRGRRTR